MSEFDVIVIGGGINGLTCAAYLAKAGAKVLVVERADEVGIHCCTNEVTLPGFRHNLCATWIWTPISPCIADLELGKYGLEVVLTEYAYGMPFSDGRCALIHSWDVLHTAKKWEKFSKKDADTLRKIMKDLLPYVPELAEKFLYQQFTMDSMNRALEILKKCESIPQDIHEMNAFELLDLLFEDEHIKVMLASIGWIGGIPPWQRAIGAMGPLALPFMIVSQLKGGSHMLPHALFRCLLDHGGEVLQSCEVEKLIIENGEAKGVLLAENAAHSQKKILAKRAVVSNLSAVPTFLQLVGEEHLNPYVSGYLKTFFNYEEAAVLFGAHYALNEVPKWNASKFDNGMQNAFMGYFGADNLRDMENFARDFLAGRLHDKIMANFFVPTLADPSQAPSGKHTAFAWLDSPFNLRREGGPEKWDEIKYKLLDKITEKWEEYAPNVRSSVLATYAHTPLDIYRRNPSAIKGNWCGGAVAREQIFPRPFLMDDEGRLVFAPKTPIKKFYISNSIWPWGTTSLGSGYIAASAVATDLGIREQPWWRNKPLQWWLGNLSKVTKNIHRW